MSCYSRCCRRSMLKKAGKRARRSSSSSSRVSSEPRLPLRHHSSSGSPCPGLPLGPTPSEDLSPPPVLPPFTVGRVPVVSGRVVFQTEGSFMAYAASAVSAAFMPVLVMSIKLTGSMSMCQVARAPSPGKLREFVDVLQRQAVNTSSALVVPR